MDKQQTQTEDESNALNILLNEDGNSRAEPSNATITEQEQQHEPSRHTSSIEVLQPETNISIQTTEPESHTEPQPESQTQKEPQTDRNDATEPQERKIEPLQPEPQSQSISILHSITAIETFISYMNKRFNLPEHNNLIVLIQRTELNVKGYFSPNSWGVFKHNNPEQECLNLDIEKNIHEISLSSINLIFEPYETIAHEYAHFLNTHLDKYEGNTRNYHTLDFKKRAEQLLLRVEKGIYGFNQTYETEPFKNMVKDFLNEYPEFNDAFKIFQPTDSRIIGIDGNGKPRDKDGNIIKPTPKSPSRLILYTCSCGVKIRTARNKDKPLKAVCGYCNTEFKEVIKDGIKPEPEPSQTEPDNEPESNPDDESNHREPITPTEFNECLNAEVTK
jgi:hypothetical protein